MQEIETIWCVLTGCWMLLLSLRVFKFTRKLQFLRAVRVKEELAWPKISLIVPACNEAQTIASAAQSLLSMDYPNLELIVVDDRSTDDTQKVVRALAEKDARIKAVRVELLPEGWLGKVHALHQGVRAASGEWLLFSDADVHYRKESLKKAMSFCNDEKLDFLSVTPSIIGGTFTLRMIVAHFLHWATLSIDLERVSDPRYKDALGGGAFNLVRRSSYESSGGLEWIKMDVIDDVGLAYTLKQSKAKLGVLSGLDEIELEWYPNFWAFVKGIEKNGFAATQYSVLLLSVFILGVLMIFLGFTLMPLVAGQLWVEVFVWGSLVWYLAMTARSLNSMMQVSPVVILFFPILFVVMPLVFIRSAVKCLRQKGIYWRGTFYPLAALRAGQRLKITEILLNSKF